MNDQDGLRPGWGMYQAFIDEWHINPEDEDHLHLGTECACTPESDVINGITIVVHNSYDGREALEEANLILNSAK